MARDGTETDPLTPRKEAAAVALATGKTIKAAARACGVGARTIKRWLAERPEFAGRVTEVRASMTDRAIGLLTDAQAVAVDTLRALLRSGNDYVKLGAARALAELGVKFRDIAIDDARLTALETVASGRTP